MNSYFIKNINIFGKYIIQLLFHPITCFWCPRDYDVFGNGAIKFLNPFLYFSVEKKFDLEIIKIHLGSLHVKLPPPYSTLKKPYMSFILD